jgi:hypothetical protein
MARTPSVVALQQLCRLRLWRRGSVEARLRRLASVREEQNPRSSAKRGGGGEGKEGGDGVVWEEEAGVCNKHTKAHTHTRAHTHTHR